MSFSDVHHGRKYLVTGASRGIGKAVTEKLHSLGAIVYALAKSPENLQALKQECPKVIPICVDLEDWDATAKALEPLESVDCLINNAGIVTAKVFMDVQKDDFDSILNVNLKAAVNVSQVMAKKMIDRAQGGSIVNISSICQAGRFLGDSALIYSCSKAAMEVLTKIMAVELGPHKIRVNSVCPAMTDTELLRGYAEKCPRSAGNFAAVLNRTPTKSAFMPMEDVVNTILFLGSNATTQITGASLPVDGGFMVA